MAQELWTRVDHYIEGRLVPQDPALAAASAASAAADLSVAVSAAQGKMLHLLARLMHARRVLEVGTLGGYSAIWLGRALPPGGRVVSLEVDPRHADVALGNVSRAGLAAVVEIRVGAALETLPMLEREQAGPFDLAFIDADKANDPAYIEWAIRLGRPGTLIIVDNVVRDGSIVSPASSRRRRARHPARLRIRRRAPEACGDGDPDGRRQVFDGFLMALITDGETGP